MVYNTKFLFGILKSIYRSAKSALFRNHLNWKVVRFGSAFSPGIPRITRFSWAWVSTHPYSSSDESNTCTDDEGTTYLSTAKFPAISLDYTPVQSVISILSTFSGNTRNSYGDYYSNFEPASEIFGDILVTSTTSTISKTIDVAATEEKSKATEELPVSVSSEVSSSGCEFRRKKRKNSHGKSSTEDFSSNTTNSSRKKFKKGTRTQNPFQVLVGLSEENQSSSKRHRGNLKKNICPEKPSNLEETFAETLTKSIILESSGSTGKATEEIDAAYLRLIKHRRRKESMSRDSTQSNAKISIHTPFRETSDAWRLASCVPTPPPPIHKQVSAEEWQVQGRSKRRKSGP